MSAPKVLLSLKASGWCDCKSPSGQHMQHAMYVCSNDFFCFHCKRAASTTLPTFPYGLEELEPIISAEILQLAWPGRLMLMVPTFGAPHFSPFCPRQSALFPFIIFSFPPAWCNLSAACGVLSTAGHSVLCTQTLWYVPVCKAIVHQ